MITRFSWLPLLIVLMAVAGGACGGDEEEPAAAGSATRRPASSRTVRPTASPTPIDMATPTAQPTQKPAPPTLPPAWGGPAQVVRKGDASRRAVTLTFDAGSDAGYTAQILGTLAAHGIVAGFGITGRWAEQNPELLRRIVGDGHELINHTYDHASMTGLSTNQPPQTQEERWQELDRTEAIVAESTGMSTRPYFRPPFGDYDASVNEDVGARGYAYNIMWTVDSGGWRGLSASTIRQRCLELAEPGAIYVFHVGSASQDGPALQSIIDDLRAAGYEIVSLSELLAV